MCVLRTDWDSQAIAGFGGFTVARQSSTTMKEKKNQRERARERGIGNIDSFRPLPLICEGVQVDDVQPHSIYYNYAYEQENQHTNENVFDWNY